METQEYVTALRRGWWLILLAVVLFGGLAFALSKLTTPAYTATSQVFVAATGGNTSADLANGSNYTTQAIPSFAALATTPLVLSPVIDQLGLNTTPTQLAKSIDVSTPQGTTFLLIATTDQSAALAAKVSDAVAEELRIQIPAVADSKAVAGGTSVKATVVGHAPVPQAPSAPKTTLNTILGAVLGGLAALTFLLLRAKFDTRIRRQSDVSRVTDAPVLGSVARQRGGSKGLIMVSNAISPEAESYRQLRTDLQFVAVDRSSLALVVTSSVPDEGKSTVTCNLALAMVEAGRRVLVIDADLRKPSIARYLGLEGAAGLTTVLVGQAGFDDVVQRWGDTTLDILTSGVVPPNPSELLSSQAMESLLGKLREQYDVILIDSAPSLAVADPAIVARLVDGALVIADATQVRRQQLERTVGMLNAAGARVLGVVLNRVKLDTAPYLYYGEQSNQTKISRKRKGTAKVG